MDRAALLAELQKLAQQRLQRPPTAGGIPIGGVGPVERARDVAGHWVERLRLAAVALRRARIHQPRRSDDGLSAEVPAARLWSALLAVVPIGLAVLVAMGHELASGTAEDLILHAVANVRMTCQIA